MKQDTSAKPVEVAPEVTSQAEEVSTDKASEESPAEDKSESPPAASEEAPPAVVEEETPAAVEESNDGNASEEVVEETPDEIKVCSSSLTLMCFAHCVLSAHLMVSFLFSLRRLPLISVSRQLTKQGIVSHVTLNITGENTVFLL